MRESHQCFLHREENRRLWSDLLSVGQIIMRLKGNQWKATHPRIEEYCTLDLTIVKRRRRRGGGEEGKGKEEWRKSWVGR